MSGGHGSVRGGQGPPEPVPGLSPEEMSSARHEQGWYGRSEAQYQQ